MIAPDDHVVRVRAARERGLLHGETVAARLGEGIQDGLVDIQEIRIDDHRAGLAGEHGEDLAVDAEDGGFGLGVEQRRVHPVLLPCDSDRGLPEERTLTTRTDRPKPAPRCLWTTAGVR